MLLNGRKILVTGGTGSLGKEIVKQLLYSGTMDKIIVYSRDEYKQAEMRRSIDDSEKKIRY